MPGLSEAERTAKETAIAPILLFVLAVMVQLTRAIGFRQDFDLDLLFRNLFITGLVLAFVMGLTRNIWYLLGLIVGTFILGVMYNNIENNIVIQGVSFKQAINPMPSILQVAIWVFGVILRMKFD